MQFRQGRSALRLGSVGAATIAVLLWALPGVALAYSTDIGPNHASPATYSVCVRGTTCQHTIATIPATSLPAGLYRATSTVTIGNTTDTVEASATVSCTSNVSTSTSGDENVLVGSPKTMQPTLMITVPAGPVSCALKVQGVKSQLSTATYDVQSGWIHLTGPFLTGSENLYLAPTSGNGVVLNASNPSVDLVDYSHSIDASAQTVELYPQVHATTCEDYAGDAGLGCPSGPPPYSYTDFTVQVIFAQYPYPGGPYSGFCWREASSVYSVHLTSSQHHLMVYSGYLAAHPHAGCDPVIKPIVRITYTGGSSLGLSANNSTLLSVAVDSEVH